MRPISIALIAIATMLHDQCLRGSNPLCDGSLGSEFGTLDLTTGVFDPIGPADTGFYGDITTQSYHRQCTPWIRITISSCLIEAPGRSSRQWDSWAPTFIGLKFGPNGVLYGYNGGFLYQVNPSTASATLIGSYGINTGVNYGATFVGNYSLPAGGESIQSYSLDPSHRLISRRVRQPWLEMLDMMSRP